MGPCRIAASLGVISVLAVLTLGSSLAWGDDPDAADSGTATHPAGGIVRPEPAGGMADAGWSGGEAATSEGAATLSADQIHQSLQDQLVAGVARPRIDLNIEFEFNSARLTPLGRRDLDEAGETIVRYFPDNRFVLAGHTDSIGAEDYNLALSVERAKAARAYLLSTYEIEPSRLEARGHGEQRPLPGQPDERNRRVELELQR